MTNRLLWPAAFVAFVAFVALVICVPARGEGEFELVDGKWVAVAEPKEGTPAGELAIVRRHVENGHSRRAVRAARQFLTKYRQPALREQALGLAGDAEMIRGRYFKAYGWYEKQLAQYPRGQYAERALTRDEREEIQRALQWDGFYAARIDGAFGPGTRRAIEGWQASKAYPATGVLLTVQRNELVRDFRTEVASLGLATVSDPQAGIEITLPTALVTRARAEAPFVHYDPAGDDGVRVLLISLPGDATTLTALYDVMQTLEIVPLTGPRALSASSFTITGETDAVISDTYAELRSGAVKGFTLIWPRGDEKRRQRALSAMRASFTPLPGQVLSDEVVPLDDARRRALLSGLEIRRPVKSGTGFFIDGAGRVLTAADGVAGCARVTLGDEVEASLAASDAALGLALLTPRSALSPLAYAGFDAGLARAGSEIAVSGFSFGGVLGAPTMTFGTLEDTRSLDGREDLTRLALLAEEGDNGGPVFDTRGSVLGMLLPQAQDGARRLPDEVRYAADAEAIALFLSANGVAPRPAVRGAEIAPEDLALLAADMTVLVECWN